MWSDWLEVPSTKPWKSLHSKASLQSDSYPSQTDRSPFQSHPSNMPLGTEKRKCQRRHQTCPLSPWRGPDPLQGWCPSIAKSRCGTLPQRLGYIQNSLGNDQRIVPSNLALGCWYWNCAPSDSKRPQWCCSWAHSHRTPDSTWHLSRWPPDPRQASGWSPRKLGKRHKRRSLWCWSNLLASVGFDVFPAIIMFM